MSFSCEKEAYKEPKLIINGILTEGKQAQISVYALFESETPYEQPVKDAEVIIEKRGINYNLEPVDEQPGVYKNSDLEIMEGELYKLSVFYKGIQAFSETTIPGKPQNLASSTKSLIYPSETEFSFAISWQKQTEFSYLTLNSVSEFDNEKISIPTNENYTPFYLEQPYQQEIAIFSLSDFKYYGTNTIKIFSINEEYRMLYEYQRLYKFDNPPIETNIINGLGIFTGISYDSINVNVIKP